VTLRHLHLEMESPMTFSTKISSVALLVAVSVSSFSLPAMAQGNMEKKFNDALTISTTNVALAMMRAAENMVKRSLEKSAPPIFVPAIWAPLIVAPKIPVLTDENPGLAEEVQKFCAENKSASLCKMPNSAALIAE